MYDKIDCQAKRHRGPLWLIHAPIKAGIGTCTNVHSFQSVFLSNTKGAAIIIAVMDESRRRGKVEAETTRLLLNHGLRIGITEHGPHNKGQRNQDHRIRLNVWQDRLPNKTPQRSPTKYKSLNQVECMTRSSEKQNATEVPYEVQIIASGWMYDKIECQTKRHRGPCDWYMHR